MPAWVATASPRDSRIHLAGLTGTRRRAPGQRAPRAGITTLEAANAYLRDQCLPDYPLSSPARPPTPAGPWSPLGDALDLDALLADAAEHVVGRDNGVSVEGVALPLVQQPGRRRGAGLHVLMRRHRRREHPVWRGPQGLGRSDATGSPLDGPRPRPPKLSRASRRSRPAARPPNARAHWA